jgi:hypothetical protein
MNTDKKLDALWVGIVNTYVRDGLTQHLRRRSQRPFRPPEGVSFYKQVRRFGLVSL